MKYVSKYADHCFNYVFICCVILHNFDKNWPQSAREVLNDFKNHVNLFDLIYRLEAISYQFQAHMDSFQTIFLQDENQRLSNLRKFILELLYFEVAYAYHIHDWYKQVAICLSIFAHFWQLFSKQFYQYLKFSAVPLFVVSTLYLFGCEHILVGLNQPFERFT